MIIHDSWRFRPSTAAVQRRGDGRQRRRPDGVTYNTYFSSNTHGTPPLSLEDEKNEKPQNTDKIVDTIFTIPYDTIPNPPEDQDPKEVF